MRFFNKNLEDKTNMLNTPARSEICSAQTLWNKCIHTSDTMKCAVRGGPSKRDPKKAVCGFAMVLMSPSFLYTHQTWRDDGLIFSVNTQFLFTQHLPFSIMHLAQHATCCLSSS